MRWLGAMIVLSGCTSSEPFAPLDAGHFDSATVDDATTDTLTDGAAEDAAERAKDAGEADPGDAETPSTGMVADCSAVSSTDFECTLDHDGLGREYLLHVPDLRPAEGAPLLFNLHGLASSPQQQRDISLMIAKSDLEGFIVVHPQGTGTLASWNAGFCCSSAASDGVDDVGFILAMIERIAEALEVDRSRIFATGLSNGGHMAYRLACEQSEVFAAIAPVAAVVALVPCSPSRPVPVLHFHGTADRIVGYDTGSSTGGSSAPETVRGWAERNGCSMQTDVSYQMGDTTCEAYRDCVSGSAAELCTIIDGGHTWPGGDNPAWLGRTTTDIFATDYVWSFFLAHPR